MTPRVPERPPCRAHSSRTGQPCKNRPIIGGTVCKFHGGGSPQVKRKAAERIHDLLGEQIDPDRVLREAARLAYSDVRQLFDEGGKLLPVKQWPDGLAAAIGGVEVVKRNVDSGDDRTDDVIKVKVWDKPKAVELLFRHLGLIKDRLDLGVTADAKELLARLAEGRRRVSEAAKKR